MLRVAFPTTIRSDKASFDIQYGYAERNTHRNLSWDMARFEVAAHKYADLSDRDYGVALLNDCKYGYKVLENVIDLNLLRSPTHPDPDADLGHHEFTYSLLPHTGTLIESDVIAEATQLNQPPAFFAGCSLGAATVPFTVGGGITDVDAASAVLEAGATKVSVSSAAFRKPDVIKTMIKALGGDKVTVAIDAAANPGLPSGYEVFIDGGRTATGTDAIEWARQLDGFGVGTILPTSKTTDGVRTGYDLPLIRKIKAVTAAPVVASGGAGTLEHFYEAVVAGATILLAASVFHFQIITIPELKAYLRGRGVEVPGA